MSIAGITSNLPFDYGSQTIQSKMRQFQQEFEQLGQDLQSGNLSAAQSDFATLQQYAPETNSSSASQSSSPIAQDFSQLSQDLKSGNLSAAQSDFSTLQQDFQNASATGHHHHHGSGGGSSAISQLIQQLGQALQSGSLTSAQQAYSTLQQEFQQFMLTSGGTSSSATQSVTGSVSTTA
jgi:outer membrane protein assembly factor BamD (BamD/ComL family)